MENTPSRASALHRLTYLAAGATLTVVVSVSVSACTGSPTSTGKTSPAASANAPPAHTTTTPPPAAAASPHTTTATAHATTASPHTTTATAHATTASPHTTTAPAVPAGPPSTGGGGTAGLQDGLLFGIGGAALLAGLGSLAYRRRLTRQGLRR